MNSANSFPLLTTLLMVMVFSLPSFSQVTVETRDSYTNFYHGKKIESGKNIYLVMSFTENFDQYFFDQQDNALLTILKADGSREEKTISKSDFYIDPQSGFREYYHFISNNRKIASVADFEIFISSMDGTNYARQTFGNAERKKLIRDYEPPATNASMKKKLKHYQKTGDSQGQLFGATREFRIGKRAKCRAKKRKISKDGVNGVKAMTYGM